MVERYTQMPRPPAAAQHLLHSRLSPTRRSDCGGGVQDLSMSPPSQAAANHSPPPSCGRSCGPSVSSPPRAQNAVAVSVLKRSPPPVAASQSRKGGPRRLTKKNQEEEEEEEPEEDDEGDVEVVEVKRPKVEEEEEAEVEALRLQSFCGKSAKEMERPKEEEDEEFLEEEEEDEEENGLMEVDDDSGAEDKEKDLIRCVNAVGINRKKFTSVKLSLLINTLILRSR